MDLRFLAILLLTGLQFVESSLKGKLISCRHEGEAVEPPQGADKCIKCACRDKSVQCWKPKCPGAEGCHVLLTHKPKKSCCHVCRGCLHNGREMLNGESYQSADKCTEYTCKASIVTISPTKCHVPCSNPVHVPGQCCPLCPANHTTVKGGCFYDNEFIANGQDVTLKGDRCTQCTCLKGKLSCAKRACPVLNCPESKIIQPDNECCPRCKGSRKEDYPTNGDCIFRGKRVKSGKDIFPDKCTKCQCKDGSTVCDREVCPILNCPYHAVIQEKGECCPKCREVKSCPASEETDKENREHDEQWKRDSCTSCHCYGGKVACNTVTCTANMTCPDNMIKVHLAGQCCPTCVESDSRCTVSGSGSDNLQYTTFDRKHYKFNGVCKYVLAKDYVNDRFSIRIKQGYKTPTTYSVKLLQILLKTPNDVLVSITMDTRLVAKVNKTVVKSGYNMPKVYMIEKGNLTVSLTLLALKVKVTLSADGYTEVIASRDWQQKLTGLCGDYNELAADDLRGKDKVVYVDGDKFAKSWQIGGRCSCDEKVPITERHAPCSAHPKLRLVARQRCDVFRDDVFKLCRKVINYRPYYLTCLDNVCTCDKNSKEDCECPTVLAYEKECHKHGIRIKLPEGICNSKTDNKPEKEESTNTSDKKLHEESKFVQSSDSKSRIPDKPLQKLTKPKKTRRTRKTKKSSKSKPQHSPDIEKLKAELTKKHARKQKPKPRGPDSILFG